MKHRVVGVRVLIGFGILLVLSSLYIPNVVWKQALTYPWGALADSDQQLKATLLDVSQSGDSLRSATRRILKPFGTVTLIKIYPSDDGETPSRRPLPD